MKEAIVVKYVKYISALFLVVFCTAPFLWMVLISLTDNPDFLSSSSALSLTLKNYEEILTNDSLHFIRYLTNSVVVALVSAAAATLAAALSAYAVTRLSFPGRIIIPVTLLAFSMFPQISIAGSIFTMMTILGWINTYPALIFPYISFGMPLALWILLSYFSRIPKEMDQAAVVDGATRFQIMRNIIFPIALPGIFSTLVLVFIYSFSEFLFALLLTIDYHARTVPAGIALFEGLHGQVPWGYIMAASLIALLPIILLIALLQRFIVQGLMRGAVKG